MREIGDIQSDHVSSRAGDTGRTGIRRHLYVQAVPASRFGFNLRGVESKARREFCAGADMNKT